MQKNQGKTTVSFLQQSK